MMQQRRRGTRRTRAVTIAGLAMLVATAVVGCDPADRGAPLPDSTPPAGNPTSGSVVATPESVTGFEGQQQVADLRTVTEETYFTSPSGRIVCGINLGEAGVARCDVREADWTIAAPAGKNCDPGEWTGGVGPGGSRMLFILDRRPMPNCAGDPLDPIPTGDRPVLPYGHAVTDGVVTCVSEERGVRCQLNDDGQGFRISYQAAEFLCAVGGILMPAAPTADPCAA